MKTKRHSFFTRLFLGNLLLVAVIVCVAGLVSYGYLNASYRRAAEANQDQVARMARHHFEGLWPADRPRIDAECKALSRGSPLRLTVIDAAGWVLGDSEANPATMGNHRTDDRPEVLSALRGQRGRHQRPSETVGVEYRYLAEPIRKDGGAVGVVRVAMPVRALAEGSGLIRNALLWSALIAAAAAVLLAALLSWLWYSPLRQITRAARKIASGDLSSRAGVAGSRELAQLGAALNDMRTSLKEQIDQIATQRGDLHTVVSNLGEGITALDGHGRIVLMNASAGRLFDATDTDATGRNLQEIVRVADVVEAFNETERTGQPVSRRVGIEVDGAQRTIDLQAVSVAGAAAEGIRVLLVARDVTEAARIAAVKTEFVANASHELRTPLATIRAAVDSLASIGLDDQEELEKIRAILDRHATRLEEMTNDLLDLHLIETSKQQLQLEEIEADLLVNWAEERFAEQAETKGVSLRIAAEDPPWRLTSDRTLVRLILQNLIDNAVKFTPAGGRVECLLQRGEDHVLLRVSDTGCGIPSELHDRVFERFFQVDTSRAGDAGTRGTGLGLAIVKHAVDRLGAKVNLHSELEHGTTVTVFLPEAGPAPTQAAGQLSGDGK